MTEPQHRMDVVRFLIEKFGLKRYLEIGCLDDGTFASIRVPDKTGVDPAKGGTHRMTSDDFFLELEIQNHRPKPFDLIFIDGDHRHPQVIKDVDNARRWLAPSGFIVMHDVFPQDPHLEDPSFCGTAWRAFVWARQYPDLDGMVITLPQDPFGIGVLVQRPSTAILPSRTLTEVDQWTWSDLKIHENDWMRRGTWKDLLRFLKLE